MKDGEIETLEQMLADYGKMQKNTSSAYCTLVLICTSVLLCCISPQLRSPTYSYALKTTLDVCTENRSSVRTMSTQKFYACKII